MMSIKATAHRAGAIYFAFMIVAITGEFLTPAFVVAGDAAATARNITASPAWYRLEILVGFVTLVLFILLVNQLYQLFRDVRRGAAMLMVLLVAIGVTLALADLLFRFGPLVLLSGADYLAAFTRPQLDALSLGLLRIHSYGAMLTSAFWGLWLFPFGVLVIRSGWFPRILGWLLLVAGAAYLAGSVVSLVLPDYGPTVGRLLMPLYFGEVPIIFWLLIKGANAPESGSALP